jgi:transposase InsO family protein
VKVYPFIAAEKPAERNVAKTCALLSVSRTAYYQWSKHVPSQREQHDRELTVRIRVIHKASRGTYGAPRVHRQLHQEGERSSRKRVARLMAEDGLVGRHKRRTRRTTIPGDVVHEAGDLLQRDFAPQAHAIDTAWVGDITYLRTTQGWAYLATVIDLASRRVVGFSIANHMRTSLIEAAMREALHNRQPKPGLIFHSDRGSQYTSATFQQLLAQHQVRPSFSRPRQCWDNAVAESFFSTLKTELIHRQAWQTVAEVKTAVFDYIEGFYNRRRLHSALGYQSPAAYESCMLSQSQAASAA